jgi:branched-subunit amino acid ABC-type transport system permease component
VLKRIYGTKNATFAGVLVTYGLAIMIPDLVRMTFGRPGKPFAIPEALSGSLFRIGALDVHSYRVFILVVTAALLPLLWLLLNKTNLGLVIRAGTSDNLMVQLLGINVARTWTTTYALGAALAAFAGVITAPLVAVAPEMGGLVLIECFIVTVVGGMGTFLGVVAGGLLIGETLALTGMLYDVLADVVIYLAMALVLLVRPRGLFGQGGCPRRKAWSWPRWSWHARSTPTTAVLPGPAHRGLVFGLFAWPTTCSRPRRVLSLELRVPRGRRLRDRHHPGPLPLPLELSI